MASVGRRRAVVALLSLVTLASGSAPSIAAPPPVAADECGTISGQVRHADGTPIPGASVRLANSDLDTLGSTTADGDGNYVIDVVPQQAFWVHAFVDEIQRLTVVGGDAGISLGCESATFDVEVGSGGVSGVLTDADGNPGVGYYVQVCGFYYAGMQYCHEPQTGPDGSYSVLYLRPGANTVRVLDGSGPLPLTVGDSVSITIDESVQTLDLQLADPNAPTPTPTITPQATPPDNGGDPEPPTGSVSGVLSYPDTSPIADAYVYLVAPFLGFNLEARTDAAGYFSVPEVEPGDYFVSAFVASENRSMVTANFEVGASAEVVNLSLPSGGRSGFVTYSDDSPASDIEIEMCGLFGARPDTGWCAYATTDGNGFYQMLYLEPGTATVGARRSGQPVDLVGPSETEIGASVESMDLQLVSGPIDPCDEPQGTPGPGDTPMPCGSPQPSPSLSGYVRDSDGQELADVLVNVEHGGQVVFQTATGADGYYEIQELPADTEFTVCAATESYYLCQAFTTTGAPQVIDLTVPAPDPGYVFGTVTATDGGELYGGYIDICGDPECDNWIDQTELIETGDPNAWTYQTNELPVGEYFLQVWPYERHFLGRFPIARTETVAVSGATQHDIVLDIAPVTTVQGRITHTDGSAAAGVFVAACFYSSECQAGGWFMGVGDGARYGRTNQNGDYVLNNVPIFGTRGSIAYRPADSGINVVSHTGGFTEPTFVHDIVINRPSGGVDGHFRYADGSPVVGARISWSDPTETDEWGDPVSRNVAPTGADGSFRIRGLAPGTYQITGYDEDARREVSADVAVGTGIATVVLQHGPLPGGGLRGTVVDHLGDPVPEAEVDFTYQTGPESGAGGFTRADENGVFEILFLPPFGVSGTIYHPNGDRWLDFQQPIGDAVVEVTYTLPQPPTAVISGTLTIDGEPQPFTFLEACSATRCEGAETDENGRYAVGPLNPGFYLFSLGRFEDPAGPIEVGYDSFQHDVAIVLPTGGVRGSLTSGGAPVADVEMTACALAGCVSGWANELGQYEFELLPPGDYHIVVHHGGAFADPGSPVTVAADVVTHDIEITGGSISGNVTAGGQPAPFAWVQACRDGHGCVGSSADEQGLFVLTLLADGTYTITAHPNGGGFLPTGSASAVTVTDGSAEDAGTIDLQAVQALPADGGTSISGDGVSGGPGDVPTAIPNRPVTIATAGCAGGSGTYTITSVYDPSHVHSGALTETGAGTYETQVEFDFGGPALVEMAIACVNPAEDTSVSFNVYIDPSGWVRDTLGEPINGATVVLYRGVTPAGPWEEVPDGSSIMSPSNRSNPDVTEDDGWRNFGWDVVAGFYKVRASAPGCVDPNNPVRAYVDTIAYKIPPPVLDIDLRLFCGESAPTDETDPTVLITTPADGADYPLGSVVAADYACADEDGGSGLASCVGDVADGAPIDTSTPGLHSFSVTASDAAGNTTTASVTFRVVYEFALFGTFAAPPAWNKATAAGNVNLRFSLDGVTDLDAIESVMSRTISCATQAPVGALSAAGMSSPALDDAGRYQVAWKTDKAWAGTCREVVIELDDGTTHSMLFELAKKGK